MNHVGAKRDRTATTAKATHGGQLMKANDTQSATPVQKMNVFIVPILTRGGPLMVAPHYTKFSAPHLPGAGPPGGTAVQTETHTARRDAGSGRWLPKAPISDIWARATPEPNSGCWLWTDYLGKGYGRFGSPPAGHTSVLAHRVFYEILVGPIPEGMTLDHKCRVRCCVNPGHMEPVTMKVNVARGIGPTAINGRKTECPRGHELSGNNLIVNNRGSRECRECTRARFQRMRLRAKERNHAV